MMAGISWRLPIYLKACFVPASISTAMSLWKKISAIASTHSGKALNGAGISAMAEILLLALEPE